MRDLTFSTQEYYHIWNCGVDKRNIFKERSDVERFLLGIEQFNTPDIIGEIGRGHRVSTDPKLVEIIAYCINPNHFHLLLEPVVENGLEKFMHKLGMGYSKYFNTKYRRSGSLFEGKFKAKHIDSNEYLLRLSAYINLNDMAHGRGHRVSTLSRSSWEEYISHDCGSNICKKEIVLDQFKSRNRYRKFAEDTLSDVISRKDLIKELELDHLRLVN